MKDKIIRSIPNPIGYIVLRVASLVYFIYLLVTHQYVVRGAETISLPGQILTWASLGWFLLEVITMLTNSKRRAIHDYIAKTVVVEIS